MTVTIESLSDELAEIAAKTLEIEQRSVELNAVRRADYVEYLGLKLAYAEKLDELIEFEQKTDPKNTFWKTLFRRN